MKSDTFALVKILLVSFITCLLLNSCIKPVVFGAYKEELPNQDVNVTRIFLDRDGSLYPDSLIKVDDELLDEKIEVENTEVHVSLHKGYLLNYFRYVKPEEYKQLKKRYNIPDYLNKTREWADLQYAMQTEIYTKLNRRLAEQSIQRGDKSTLVVLIHGYNVPQEIGKPYGPYEATKQRIKNDYFKDQPVEFLEVYWDGMQGNPLTIWSYAQANAAFVGLTLRGILDGVEKEYPIRILTHSLGATVATNALWNVRAVKQSKKQHGDTLSRWWVPKEGGNPVTKLCFGDMRTDSVHYKTPQHPNLRLASIAPAQPGLTYIDYLNRTPYDPDSLGWYQRVIIGYNNNDIATSKGLPFLAKSGFGATSLAVFKDEYGKYVYPRVTEANYRSKTKAYWIDLYPNRIFYSGHGLVKYLAQPATAKLLDLLFKSDAVNETKPTKRKKEEREEIENCLDCSCN